MAAQRRPALDTKGGAIGALALPLTAAAPVPGR